ncbi:hypothetical protein [Nitrospira sp. BLG_2]|uniref:hypothetical protein n=1 Tax=Nitrospira sp. BLG_2 TaxID=3397507 RepID=UPI003BA06899
MPPLWSFSLPACYTGIFAREGTMSANGSLFIGIVGSLMFLISVFAFSQRNWKGGLIWLVVGAGLIALLTYMDKPSANLLQ